MDTRLSQLDVVRFITPLAALLLVAAICGGAVDGAESTMTVPVRILPPPAPAPEPMVAPGTIVREEPEPATPGARLPQYQLHHLDRGESLVDASNPDLRIILALPGRPLIVSAKITIDGQPYAHTREQRVQEILDFAAAPEKFKARLARWENAKAVAASLLDSIKNAVTNAATPNVEAKEETEPAEGEEEPSEEPEIEAVPEFVNPATIYERIERYMAATGEMPTAEEIHWLLTNWVDGPTVLFLKDNFQRFRADQRPVYKVLDRDRDGIVSEKELKMAVSSFWECDLNRNDIVEATELAEVVNDPRTKSLHAGQGLLISRLPTNADAVLTYRRLAACYPRQDTSLSLVPRFDLDNDGRFSAEELESLRQVEPDIRLSVAFDTRSAKRAVLAVEGFSDDVLSTKPELHQHPYSVTLSVEGHKVDFLAVQGPKSDQVSVGAVDDGYPLLPALDPNGDGQFTIRELRQLNELLSTFDENTDGSITSDETHSTIRICFGLGATVHRQLSVLRSVQSPSTEEAITGPNWFHQMDRNKDNDISRKEFPGTDEQFDKYDADADKLISTTEALDAE